MFGVFCVCGTVSSRFYMCGVTCNWYMAELPSADGIQGVSDRDAGVGTPETEAEESDSDDASEPGGGTQDVASDPEPSVDPDTGGADDPEPVSDSESSTVVFEDEATNQSGQAVPGRVKGVVQNDEAERRVQRFAEREVARERNPVQQRTQNNQQRNNISTPSGPGRVRRDGSIVTPRGVVETQKSLNNQQNFSTRRNRSVVNEQSRLTDNTNRITRISPEPVSRRRSQQSGRMASQVGNSRSGSDGPAFRLSQSEREALREQDNPARQLSIESFDQAQQDLSQGDLLGATGNLGKTAFYGTGGFALGTYNLARNAKANLKQGANTLERIGDEIVNPDEEAEVTFSADFIGTERDPELTLDFRSPTAARITKDVAQSAIQNPVGFGAEALAGAGFGIGASKGLRKAAEVTRDTGVRVVGRKVDPEDVFADKNTVDNIDESMRRFQRATDEDGNPVVQTSAPQRLEGDEAGAGSKPGLEDQGIYVTPKGEGNEQFLRITSGESGTSSVTLNPVEALKPETPQVVEFETQGVRRLPDDVASQPGFDEVERYFERRDNTGEAFITKRSEVGTGERTAQEFTATQRVDKGDLQVEPGDQRVEAGTSELEAVVPKTQGFDRVGQGNFVQRLAGFNRYTEVNGRAVPIRRASLRRNADNGVDPASPDVDQNTGGTMSAEDIQRGQRSLSRVRRGDTQDSPLPVGESPSFSRASEVEPFGSTPRSSRQGFRSTSSNPGTSSTPSSPSRRGSSMSPSSPISSNPTSSSSGGGSSGGGSSGGGSTGGGSTRGPPGSSTTPGNPGGGSSILSPPGGPPGKPPRRFRDRDVQSQQRPDFNLQIDEPTSPYAEQKTGLGVGEIREQVKNQVDRGPADDFRITRDGQTVNPESLGLSGYVENEQLPGFVSEPRGEKINSPREFNAYINQRRRS
jgi:hypothetical protein